MAGGSIRPLACQSTVAESGSDVSEGFQRFQLFGIVAALLQFRSVPVQLLASLLISQLYSWLAGPSLFGVALTDILGSWRTILRCDLPMLIH